VDNGAILISDLRERLERLKRIPGEVALEVAPLIEQKYRTDSISHRGNVPFTNSDGSAKSIEVRVEGEDVRVSGPDWSMAIAHDRGQPDEWLGIIQNGIREALAK
jgi:hypothetical protein